MLAAISLLTLVIHTRMREEYDATGSTEHAVVAGIGRTGRLVTSAALVLFLSFVSLSTTPVTDMKVLATGLGAGILRVAPSALIPAEPARSNRTPDDLVTTH